MTHLVREGRDVGEGRRESGRGVDGGKDLLREEVKVWDSVNRAVIWYPAVKLHVNFVVSQCGCNSIYFFLYGCNYIYFSLPLI